MTQQTQPVERRRVRQTHVSSKISELEREWRSGVMLELAEIKKITVASAQDVSKLTVDVAVLKAQVRDLDDRQDKLEKRSHDEGQATQAGQRVVTAQMIAAGAALLISLLNVLFQHVAFR
jgi:hypothetical protein